MRPDASPLRFAWLWWGLGLAYMAGIFWGSMLPLSKVQHGAVPDYLQHFIGYSAMGFWFGQLHPKHVWVAVALVAFGFSIEVLQPILSDRMFEWGDVTVNALAILVGLLVSRTQAGGLVGVLDRRLARR